MCIILLLSNRQRLKNVWPAYTTVIDSLFNKTIFLPEISFELNLKIERINSVRMKFFCSGIDKCQAIDSRDLFTEQKC